MSAKRSGFVAAVLALIIAMISLLIILSSSSLGNSVNGQNGLSAKLQETTTTTQHDPCSLALSHASANQPDEIDPITLSKNLFTLLHIGKAGGGAFKGRVESQWKIKYKQCHPDPCLQRLTSNEKAVFVLTLRDPIDRFESAFYWQAILLCNPDGDKRKIGAPALFPRRFCRRPRNQQQRIAQEIVYHKYKHNVNHLAESLCNNDSSQSRQSAVADIKEIVHARNSIGDWLGDEWKRMAPSVMPIVLEESFDIYSQVDRAIHWINNHTNFLSSTDLALRQNHVYRLDCDLRQQQQDNTANTRVSQKITNLKHSSVTSNTVPLSSLGKKCLAQYYRRDYELLKELKELACKSKDCRDAIQSILDRRAPLLGG